MRIFLCIIFLLFELSTTFKLQGQDSENYSIFKYTSKNGLPQNSIKSLVMDNNRFLWMTTEGGIVRFDGLNFKVFNHLNTPEIANDRFYNILKTADGKFITNESSGNVFEIKNGKLSHIKNNNIKEPTGSIIFGGVPDSTFLSKMYSKQFPFNNRSKLYEFHNIYPLSNEQFVIRNGTIIRLYNKEKELKEFDLSSYDAVEFFMLQDALYFFNDKNELFSFSLETGKLNSITVIGDVNDKYLKKFSLYKNVIWDYANGSVYLRLGKQLINITQGESPNILFSKTILSSVPENCFVLNAFYDSTSQHIFVGTDSKGLYIYKKKYFSTTLSSDSINYIGSSFYSLFALDSHTVYAGFNREFTFNGVRKSRYDFGNHTTECMLKDNKNNIYIPHSEGLKSYNSTTNEEIKLNSIENDEFHCFYEDGDSVLSGSKFGIGYIKNNRYYHINAAPENHFNYRIEDIIRGPDNRIWVANCTGVSTYNEQNNNYDTIPGLQNICARAFFKLDSILLIGTYSDGYVAWINNRVIRFPLDKNKYLSHVHSFSVDNNSNLWMSTNKGLLRTNLINILNYINQPSERISYYYYGEDDGILNTEFNGGCSPPMLRLKNGYAVYPTLEGLVWFIPEELPEIIPDEQIFIDEIRIDGKPLKDYENIIIPSKHESVEIRFATPYWGNIASLDMDYQLEGFNKNRIIHPGTTNNISFSKLPSGNYTLRIRKLNHTGDDAIIEASVLITVEKRFYETIPFIITSVFVVLLTLFLIIKLNTRRITRKNVQLETKIAERTTELQESNFALKQNIDKLAKQEEFLKDSIKVKDKLVAVISHDIITPLKFISMVSRISKKNKETIERNKLLDSLGDIEFAADKLHNNATNILNWMKLQNNRIVPHISHIASHELVEGCMEPTVGMAEIRNVKLENQIPEEEIIQSDRHILSIILQNLISNAIKYTQDGKVTVSSELNENFYNIYITDSGIGFSENTLKGIINTLSGLNNQEKQNESWYLEHGLGFSIIADLLPHINGVIQISTELGKGSEVKLTIPFESMES